MEKECTKLIADHKPRQRWCYTVNYIAFERQKEKTVFGTQPDLLAELKSIEARGHGITSVRRVVALPK